MADYRRTDRVNQLLREELSRLIRREVKDPRVRGVTVAEVDTTGDLRHATVYVRTLGDDPTPEEAVEGLESAGGYLRSLLGRELHLRRVPEFAFEVDRTLERARRIDELLERVHREEEDPGGRGPAGDGDGRAARGGGTPREGSRSDGEAG